MSPQAFEPSVLGAFSLLPIFFLLIWFVFVAGTAIFAIVMVFRFVKAHERIAKSLEALALRPPPAPPKDPA